MTSKLADSDTAPKVYWVLLNILLYNNKVPATPPDGKFVSDFPDKAKILPGDSCIAQLLSIIQLNSYNSNPQGDSNFV